ncbi:hypothetical protein GV791_30520, partial [Nocardia cyriacigeorgica]
MSGEPGSKILTVTAKNRLYSEPSTVVELFQRTANWAPDSPAALAFYRNGWLAGAHWSVGSEPVVNASDLFDGDDAFARAEHLFQAGDDPVEVLAQPAELVNRVFDNIPAELVRADARRVATSLSIGLVDELVARVSGSALLTGMVAMGRDGLEFRVAVAARIPGTGDAPQVHDLHVAHLTARSGTERWGDATITWAAVDLRPGAEEADTAGLGDIEG